MRALFFILIFSLISPALQAKDFPDLNRPRNLDWAHLSLLHQRDKEQQTKLGWSYIISGGIGFLGGFAGQSVAQDTLEKGAYTIFQSIGIAAMGYGLYKVYIGTEEQKFFSLLENSAITVEQKEAIYRAYQIQQKDLEKKENRIRALTHGLIAVLNLTNAAQQSPGVVRDSLYFIGGVNLLACGSYTFEF